MIRVLLIAQCEKIKLIPNKKKTHTGCLTVDVLWRSGRYLLDCYLF